MGIWGTVGQAARRGKAWRGTMAHDGHTELSRRPRSLQLERFEERMLLAISPQLIAVIPNQGELLDDGDTLHASLRELTFRFDEGQVIDPATVAAIRILRGGPDQQLGTGDDQPVQAGFLGIGNRPNEVVFRFAENLPDDVYRITIVGAGDGALKNTAGDVFNDGVDLVSTFDLDLGAQVLSVVPQPIRRGPSGQLIQDRNQIKVYFNADALNPTSATNAAFYQLIHTNGTALTTDDTLIVPSFVTFDAVNNVATLTFASDLALLATGEGMYRLRIGNDDPLPLAPISIDALTDPASTFDAAMNLNVLGAATRIISGAIDPQAFPLPYPGSGNEPGHRDIPAESHVPANTGGSFGTPVRFYNFQDVYGTDPQGNTLHNLITESQKQRAREVFELYGYYLGIKFVETPGSGITVVTGDLRAANPSIPVGPGGVGGIGGGNLAIMDASENWGLSEYGGGWFTTAMHEIGHALGLGHSYDLPPLTIQGSEGELSSGNVEGVFPGDHDIVHGRHLYPTTSIDIDVFQFTLAQTGRFTAEIIAARLDQPSLLDSVLTLFDANGQVVARNDRYFGSDSFLELELAAGTYFVAVSSSGGSALDPTIADSSLGGTSDGLYELRIDFKTTPANRLLDLTGTALDGDADGRPGGVHDFWFQVATQANTIHVDKIATAGGNGALNAPYNNLSLALAAAQPGDVVRIVGNGGADGNVATLGDNRAYEIGYDQFSQPLADGTHFDVPQGVTVMVDAGAVFKMRRANVDVGTSEQDIDRREGALQILGTPQQRVYFTSYFDETIGVDTGPLPTTPLPGDWGGLVFRADSDYESNAIFMNRVNYADIRFGGGSVLVNAGENRFTPIHLMSSRPTITYNLISRSADAAMSADPNSFEDSRYYGATYTADYRRVGPDIYGNRNTQNSINALLVRIETEAGSVLTTLDVPGRFDDTDIVHYLPENLIVRGQPGGPFFNSGTGQWDQRIDARLAIDAGVVVKLFGSRIESYMGGTLIAEGDARNPVIFTSVLDDRYGAGGTFETNGAAAAAAAGNWGGIYFGAASHGSLDHVLLTFAGGVTTIEGNFDRFNPIEIHQATVRVANSVLERNQSGLAVTDRNGRGTNAQASIFVRGAQPIIVNNILRDSFGAAISINVNALNWFEVADTGRSTGRAEPFTQFVDNQGPLVRLNRLGNVTVNGMVVRGATLTTESVWDDTDIVHVLFNEVVVPNHHTYSGLRLQSSLTESLVVKLEGATAGITASGSPLDIDDRIGGTVQVIGNPVRPVVMTSLKDDSIGAGLDPAGRPQRNTDNLNRTPAPGDWRSVKIDTLSNDRNVRMVLEFEDPLLVGGSRNNTPLLAQNLGRLAPRETASDDVSRLGFTVQGHVAPGDVDVYAFQGTAGTEVWLDIDRTTHSLDTVLELVNASGVVLARSTNSTNEDENPGLLTGIGKPLFKSPFEVGDIYTTNPRDAGMRVALPGVVGSLNTYYVRVRSASANLNNLSAGETSGNYELQIRLRQTEELAGSTVRQADIRFATNGIEVIGKPTNSPLLGESFEAETQALLGNLPANQQAVFNNDQVETAQFLGNLLEQNRNTISVGGALSTPVDVDWYKFTVDYQGIQAIAGFNNGGKTWATVFDIDYADGVGRANTLISVFDEFGNLVLLGRDSDIADDQPRSGQGADMTDLTRGSAGKLDPYVGSVHLPEGTERTYYVAIHSAATLPTALNARFESDTEHQLVRLEPVAGVRRVVEDHIGFTGYKSGTNFSGASIYTDVLPSHAGPILGIENALQLKAHVTPFTLGDVQLFVSLGDTASGLGAGQNRLLTVNPLTGEVIDDVGALGAGRFDYYTEVRDIVIRPDGQLFGYQNQRLANGFQDDNAGRLIQIDPSNADEHVIGADTISNDGDDENLGPYTDDLNTISSFRVDALAYRRAVTITETNHERYSLFYSVADFDGTTEQPGIVQRTSRLFRANPTTGDASVDLGSDSNPQPWRGAIGDIEAKTAFNLVVTIDFDDEIPHINTNRATIEEGDTITARITRTGPTAYPAFVFLQSSNFGVANWDDDDQFVVIPAGERFVEVTIAAADDDTIVNGPRTIEFWATGSGVGIFYDSVSDTLDVLDPGVDPATSPALSVSLSSGFIAEPGFTNIFPGTTQGQVTRTGSTANPLVVQLINHDPSEIRFTDLGGFPTTTVTIPAGQASASFLVVGVDDLISDATERVEITAAANGYLHGSTIVSVYSEKLDIGLTTGMAYVTFTGFDLIAPAGNLIADGQTFSISDVGSTVIFEFDSGNGVQPGRVAVPFSPTDSSTLVAINIDAAINGTNLSVETSRTGSRIVIVNGIGRDVRDSPVEFDDFSLGAGGQVLYGVSENGYAYIIDEFTGEAVSWSGTADLAHFGNDKHFQGLSIGPQNLDHDGDGFSGDLAQTFFAITNNGRLFAIDPFNEILRTDVFANGADHITLFDPDDNSGLRRVTGLAFSNLDFNLWHPTAQEGAAPGHGILPSFDLARDGLNERTFFGSDTKIPDTAGGLSFYFGMEHFRPGPEPSATSGYVPYAQPVSLNGTPAGLFPQNSQYGVLLQTTQLQATEYALGLGSARGGADVHSNLRDSTFIGNNYNFPGGAKGSLITGSFSLQGYTATDKPTLYVNYFLNTNDAGEARIYGSRDGGQTWTIIATNVDGPDGELPDYISVDWNTGNSDPFQGRQPLFNTVRDPDTGILPTEWRQVRIDLAHFVGSSDVVLRFDFTSPGVSEDLKGFYIDDIIVGFAERGEMVTHPLPDPDEPTPLPDTTFFAVPVDPAFNAPSQILVGSYQLEIRRGTETQAPINNRIPFALQVRQYDTNDRLSQGFSIETPVGWAVTEGQLFTVGDGTSSVAFELVRSAELILANGDRFFDGNTFTLRGVTFEFDHNNSVAAGHVRVPYFPYLDGQISGSSDQATPADTIAASLFAAIQSANLGVQASLDGNRIGLIDLIDPLAEITFTPIVDSVAVVYAARTLPQAGHVPVVYSTTHTDLQIATRIVTAVNSQASLKVTASTRPGSARVELDGALSLTSEVLPNPLNLPTTALDDYIALDDGHLLDYTLVDTFTGMSDGVNYTVYVLDMISQQWRDASDVDHLLWQHYVQVVVPDNLTAMDTALLFIGGGSINSPPPTSAEPLAAEFAVGTGAIVVYLPNVPNQPLTYTGDPNNPRSEDESISYTYYQFNQDPTDETWPLLLPMVKSAVRAMDAAQDFMSDPLNVPTPVDIEEFVVSGGSKRGWTTWLTAAVDPRVSAIVPLVFDALNLDEQMIHHRAYYENQLDLGLTLLDIPTFIGGYSRSVQDYTQIGAMTALRTHVGQALLSIVDPYEYRDRLTMPKYIVNGAGDEFFVSDSSQFYYDGLEGPKYLRYVPNAGHGLNEDAERSARAFFRGILSGDDIPEYSWDVVGDTRIVVDTGSDPRLLEANLWFATNPFARDFRWAGGATPAQWFSVSATDEGDGFYSGQIVRPASGATAFMIELVYDSGVPGEPYKFTTQIVVTSPSGLRNTEFEVRQYDDLGDENLVRDQGQTIIEGNRISDSANAGILVTAGERDADGSLTFPGGVRNLREPNAQQLVPGVTIVNNLIARSGQVGIDFSGGARTVDVPNPSDPATTITVPELPYAAVPFGRIVNNTVYGGANTGMGIRVSGQASPTLLNNIVAGWQTGLAIDPTSTSTVVGGMVYQSNLVNSLTGNLGTFAITLAPTDPLFVNASTGNFYLAHNSQAIDSSINTLQDRPTMTTVTGPMGIAASPIVSPTNDLLGQVRVDDPAVPSPPGLGSNVFKDRGAIDRVDMTGPRVTLVVPRDNDPAGGDMNPEATHVLLDATTLLSFSILLSDNQQTPAEPFGGSGLDASTVTSERVVLRRDGVALVDGVDYFFVYEAETTTIHLFPAVGIWVPGHVYSIELDNSVTGIRDMAGNALQANRFSGETRFTIVSAPLPPTDDYGDAPASYATLMSDNGARHFVVEGFHLGSVNSADADGQPHASAAADDDDGVEFATLVVPGSTATIVVEASAAGFINAWLDFDGDGNWSQASDKILSGVPVVAGLNELTFDVPLTVTPKTTFARVRFSSEMLLGPTGSADDGEVEDYQVEIVSTVAYTVVLTDADGEELVRDVDGRYRVMPGQEVHASVYATDQRPLASGGGVFAAFADLVRTTSVLTWQAGTLEFGPDFTGSQSGTVSAGLVDEAGGVGSLDPTGGQIPQLLFTVTGLVDAGAVLGTEFLIEVDAADNQTDHQTLVYGVSQPISTSYESLAMVVDIAGWQNLANNLDVNNDGFITPLDALIVINDLNSLGPRLLPNPPIPPDPEFYIDVNGDGFVTPLDALMIINYLNSLSTITGASTSTGSGSTSSVKALGTGPTAPPEASPVGKLSNGGAGSMAAATFEVDEPSMSFAATNTKSKARTDQSDEYLSDDEVKVLVDAAWDDADETVDTLNERTDLVEMALAWQEAGQGQDGEDEWMLGDFLS